MSHPEIPNTEPNPENAGSKIPDILEGDSEHEPAPVPNEQPIPQPLSVDKIRQSIERQGASLARDSLFDELNQDQPSGPEILSPAIVNYIGTEHTYRSRNGTRLDAIKVLGLGDQADMPTDAMQSGEFELPGQQAANAQNYYRSRIDQSDGDRYNCHSFGYAVAGWPEAEPPRSRLGGLVNAIRTGKLNMYYDHNQLELVTDASNLEPGGVYGIGNGNGRIAHTLIGLREGSLSVLGAGKNRPLVIANTAQLAEFYGGKLFRIKSPSMHASSVYQPT